MKPLPMPAETPIKGNRRHWIETFTGRIFYPGAPSPLDVSIVDIAHALAMKCRFNGHARFFYSVAAHSCVLYDYARDRLARTPGEQLIVLLHDAGEAYYSDIPAPVKHLLREQTDVLKQMEHAIDRAIASAFSLGLAHPAWLKEIDLAVLHNERAALMPATGRKWDLIAHVHPLLDVVIPEWSPAEAEHEFLKRFVQCQERMKATTAVQP